MILPEDFLVQMRFSFYLTCTKNIDLLKITIQFLNTYDPEVTQYGKQMNKVSVHCQYELITNNNSIWYIYCKLYDVVTIEGFD